MNDPTTPTTAIPPEPQALDGRLAAGRPELGSALAGLRARVVASVVRKTPQVVGRYVLGRTLGSGSFGTVLEATDPELDRRVAVKLVTVRSPEEAARVVREARMLATLSHANVVSVFEVGVTEGEHARPYLVMELVDGQTVRQWLDAEPRPWRAVVDVMRQAARGLEAAHRAGMIHRDFKPDNALIGADGRVRVVDFGLARAIDEQDSTLVSASHSLTHAAPLLTPTGMVLGTPAYMAPEVFVGTVSPKSDQYSLCVSLYEGLFGERPFRAQTTEELRTLLFGHAPTLPRDRRGVPAAIGAAVLRGLARDPQARFDDLGALEAALEAGLRPHRWGLWAGGTVGVAGLLVAGLVLAGVGIPGLGSRADAVEEPPAAWETAEGRAELAELEAGASQLRALVDTAKLDASLELSAALLERARALGHPPLVVELALLRGQALGLGTDYEHAIPVLEEAYFLAQDEGMSRSAAHAASELIGVLGYQADQYENAHRWKTHAEAAFERAGLDPRQHAPYMSGVAGLAARENDRPGALAVLREAIANVEGRGEAGSSAHALLVKQLGRELYYGGSNEEALVPMAQAVALYAAHDGAQSITHAASLDNLALPLMVLGRYDEALSHHREALEIRQAILGPEHLDLARSYGNMGRVLGKLGRHEEAFAHLDRATALFTARLGPGNSSVAMAHQLRGEIHAERGPEGREDAIRSYTRAARIYDGAGVIYASSAEKMRTIIVALGGTPPPAPSIAIAP